MHHTTASARHTYINVTIRTLSIASHTITSDKRTTHQRPGTANQSKNSIPPTRTTSLPRPPQPARGNVRNAHCATTDDTTTGNPNDTWAWNGTTWTQRLPTTNPPGRSGHTLALDRARGNLVLFGGGSTDAFNDTWTWNGTNWTLNNPLNKPPARWYHATGYNETTQELFLFGGAGSTNLNDTWTWNGSNWNQRTPANADGNRYDLSMAWDGTQLVLYHSPSHQTFTWNGTTWTQRNATPGLGTTGWPGMAYDEKRQEILLFGSSFEDGFVQGATWAWKPAPTTGTINVLSSQPTASFSITGAANYGGSGTSYTITQAPPGTYTINFAAIGGYATPPNQTLTLAAGEIITFNATYTRIYNPGTLTISSNHPQASFTISPTLPGNQNPIGMQPQGGDAFARTFTNVPGGAYTITFNSVPLGGYATPSPAAVVIDGTVGVVNGTYILTSQTIDSDGDAIPDDLEWTGSIDGGRALWSMGARPFKKNVFVEVDWMDCRASWPAGGLGDCGTSDTHKHEPAGLTKVVDAFRDSPVSNPDGSPGIVLVLDTGQFGGGGPVPHANNLGLPGTLFLWDVVDLYKTTYFNSTRQRIFRYALFGHTLAPLSDASGLARGLFTSSDFVVTLGDPALTKDMPVAQAGAFMHELGHALGLSHGGKDIFTHKPNYLSVMNYSFNLPGLIKDGRFGYLDYSRFDSTIMPNLNEFALDERLGLGAPTSLPYETLYYCPGSVWRRTPISGPVNWNCNGTRATPIIDEVVQADINNAPGSLLGAGTLLKSFNDWDSLEFAGGTVGSGVSLPRETPAEESSVQAGRAFQNAPPSVSARIGTRTWQTSTIQAIDVLVTANKPLTAYGLTLSTIQLRTLTGTGQATINTTLTGNLPLQLGDLAAGATTTVRLYINWPTTVSRLSITENGAVANIHGTQYQFSLSQSLIR